MPTTSRSGAANPGLIKGPQSPEAYPRSPWDLQVLGCLRRRRNDTITRVPARKLAAHNRLPMAMPLHSTVEPASSDFARNAEAMRALVAELREKLGQVAGGGGKVARSRHTSRGKMLARERVDLLVDPGTAFLELSPLAAYGLSWGARP